VPSRIDAARAHFARISSPPPSSRGSGMRPATVANASELLHALEARRAAIHDRALKIDQETAFQMLGVGPEASSHDIQAAFFALAKMWHPDTLPPGLANMKEKCAHIFSRISEAHQRIGDPDRRALYLRELDSANEAEEQEVVRGALEAVHCFQAANVHLKRGNVVEAEVECRKALELDPEPTDYTALLLWLEALKPANHAPFKTVAFIDQLAALLAKNPSCERAFFYRGMLYKRLGEHPYALSDFKKVYGLNPDNIDAQREIRSYNTRGVKSIAPGRRSMSPPSESGRPGPDNSLLGKLFKK
jgi:curved DNA-binding protein CbpA